MKKLVSIIFLFSLIMFSLSCNKGNVNPNIPRVVINITLDPNSTLYQELNTPGGWMYVDESTGFYIPTGSDGIIVYRYSMTEFKAYERQSPDRKFSCCDENYNNCAKLIVGDNYPFIKDTCNGNMYQMLDGSLFEGEGTYPLIQYNALFEGGLLHIFN